MKIELTKHEDSTPEIVTETGTIEGVGAQVNTFADAVAVNLTSWSPFIQSVGCHKPTRDEAIAEAVRMARACGMISE